MSFENLQAAPQPEKETFSAERLLADIERSRELAEKTVKLWSGARDTLLEDLAEIEGKEGQLTDDVRLYAINECFVKLEESEEKLQDLKRVRERLVNGAGLN